MSSPRVSRRPERDTDVPFLRELYASTRAAEMAMVPWSEPEKRAFLDSQFDAQRGHYRTQFGDAEFHVLEIEGRPAGRLYLQERPDELRVVDIALLPEHRNQGLGAALMREVFAEARALGKAVRIHVEHQNPAQRLYARLGFRPIEDQGVYSLLEWRPDR